MTTVQVFEETTGLKPGEQLSEQEMPFPFFWDLESSTIFLMVSSDLWRDCKSLSGKYISRGVSVDSLDTEKNGKLTCNCKRRRCHRCRHDYCRDTGNRFHLHKSMVPPNNWRGTVIQAAPDGAYTILEPIVTVRLADGTEQDIALAQKWPIRVPRPTYKRFPASVPLVTGQRILDTLFPIAKGGTAAVPGGFGTGKTMTQHQIAKWSDADIIIYIGCGERGNEMTQVLEDFSKLIDPKSGNLMMDRTTLIANTSNMPVAAREASIYTGVTLGGILP